MIRKAITFFILIILVINTGNVFAQSEEIMMQMIDMGKPAAEHENLKQFVGQWNMESKVWMSPDGDPVTTYGKLESRLILGGRFLLSHAKGESFGMEVESYSYLGFDRRDGKYLMFGIDNMGTYMVHAKGDHDPEKNTYSLYGTEKDPTSDGMMDFKFVLTVVNKDKYTYDLYFDVPGMDLFKMSEMTFTRIK